MSRNTSISLGEHFAGFVEKQVGDGRYATASEVVRAGLRLLEERELQIEKLRAAIIAGEASGEPEAFDVEDFLSRKRRERNA
ncbi:type II toxin-antitoxin system ParD family antitoxin [Mesorhizobium microcysteis]|uniref:Type II toxin-antitoxin system ParD family antitoxin n=1 Tax=Neoaquamicrobium microcysteis TaxID=2682781 RepID=A0A5D4GSP1_9HYPH|nr:type II toxin-antitoxin system ParD family antitoxin [Mesorhizobium microcysteis]TYR30295.1 type II toxin-antitoxin system ParD family antitoxin [Mesorhizobium microcysteis]